jgi:hypothetical protein
MRKVSFSDLSRESHLPALKQMLHYNIRKHHPRTQYWEALEDIQDDLQFGYNPDYDFYFFLDELNDVVVQIEE